MLKSSVYLNQMPHTLPQLPYAYSALEPYIDEQTITIHYTKHHQAYVDKLNDALKDQLDLLEKPLEGLLANLDKMPESIRTAVRNNGGGHWNHSFFWQIMDSPKKEDNEPKGDLANALNGKFGDFAGFKKTFTDTALGRFGSGWAWLVVKNGQLSVLSTLNQDNPLMDNSGMPILGLDVWEHAYYLKYQNRRPEYIEAWWNVVNWEKVLENYTKASAT